MSAPVISVEALGKKYRIGVARHDTFRDRLVHGVGSVLRLGRSSRPAVDDFWALQDVSFTVQRGEVLGIIGRNGAGKSTLLKILSRITEPSTGRIEIRGRVASLLEVGTGFHPELTGRENIFLNGAILGMTREEIRRKFDEIVAFAEVERFLDTPVKHYSSGMYVRLAFSVAAHLEPEILIVDEVLAVGDVGFQKKCMGKMQSIAASEVRTVLFVSHNHAAIQGLCSKGLLLDGGRVAHFGPVGETLLRAEELQAGGALGAKGRDLFRQLKLDTLAFDPPTLRSGADVEFELCLSGPMVREISELAVFLTNATGARVALIDLRTHFQHLDRTNGHARFRGTIRRLPFVEGTYGAGLFINAGAGYKQDFHALEKLIVLPAPSHDGSAPYPALHRGVVELDVSLSPVSA